MSGGGISRWIPHSVVFDCGVGDGADAVHVREGDGRRGRGRRARRAGKRDASVDEWKCRVGSQVEASPASLGRNCTAQVVPKPLRFRHTPFAARGLPLVDCDGPYPGRSPHPPAGS